MVRRMYIIGLYFLQGSHTLLYLYLKSNSLKLKVMTFCFTKTVEIFLWIKGSLQKYSIRKYHFDFFDFDYLQ